MSTNRLVARLGAVSLVAALLVLPACQGEPDPIPTAVLPTPVAPTPASPSASVSSPTATSATDQAVFAYFEGRRAADALYLGGGSEMAKEQLQKYFSGGYLEFLDFSLGEFAAEGLRQEGVAEVTGMVVYEQSPASAEILELHACLDFADVTVRDRGGKQIDRGFSKSSDKVVMTRSADGWRADSVESTTGDSFEGTSCADA